MKQPVRIQVILLWLFAYLNHRHSRVSCRIFFNEYTNILYSHDYMPLVLFTTCNLIFYSEFGASGLDPPVSGPGGVTTTGCADGHT